MSIWILALILWVFCVLLGHKQGAIRAAISFVGIFISGLLAWPLSGLVDRVLRLICDPMTVWLISPIVAFVILLIIFKWVGFTVHRKVRVHYQYARDEIRLAWWLRVNGRVGLAIGFLNAFLYLVLISVPIYNLSYWTLQIAPSDGEKFQYNFLNRLGRDLDATGMSKIACAIDPLPVNYFKTADLAGLLRQNPQLGGRLAAYPPFLSLAERDDFKNLAQDPSFMGPWQNHGPFDQLWSGSQIQFLWKSQTTVDMVRGLVEANLDDLTAYLHTGQSAKYDTEPILGRWDVSVMDSLHELLKTRANVPSNEMEAMRALWDHAYSNTVFVAASDNSAYLRNFPLITAETNRATSFTTVSLQGTWQNNGNYQITLAGSGANKTATGSIDDSGLTLKIGSDRLILHHESR
ncbi:MAG TPA: CvpA family protein [Verrucomicrobiae bacterium]